MRDERTRWWAAAAAFLFLLGAACGEQAAAEMSGHPQSTDTAAVSDNTVATELAPTTTTSLAVPTTVATPGTTNPPPPGLSVGSQGPAVLTLEQKLDALHYYVGTVDDRFDGDTANAVVAFQKVTGMDRTGRATDDVVAAINTAKSPPPLVPAGGAHRVEVDLDRQVLFLYEGGNLDTILTVSTGSNQRFCSEGWCRYAVTPPGSFTIYQKDSGWETGPLGSLYNAQYFNGGIAIHGEPAVPAYPASHGCVRIPMNAAEWMPDHLSLGTPVYVVSSDAPNPTPITAGGTPVSTPTTIVPDTATAPTAPPTTTTVPSLLTQLLGPLAGK